MNIRRGRMIARSCGRSDRSWRSPPSAIGGHVYALVGTAELAEDSGWEVEAVHDFALLPGIGGIHMSFEGPARPLEDHASATDLASLATSIPWRGASDVMGALGYGGGGLVLRETRAPSAPGTRTMLVLCVLRLPEASMPDKSMFSFECLSDAHADRPSRGRLFDQTVLDVDTIGMSLCQVHKAALWGWGDEPHGFRSTMRLDVVDLCTRYYELLDDPSADPKELESIRRRTMGAVGSAHNDPQFAEFRRRMVEQGGNVPWDACPTASEEAAQDALADRIVREMRADAA